MERLDQLRAGHLGIRLYAVTWTRCDGITGADMMPHLAEHLEFLQRLQEQGILFASGPLNDEDDGPYEGAGLSIFRVDSAAAARALAEEEPFVQRGIRSYVVRRWTLNEGTLDTRKS